MILVTRLNGTRFALNADLIERVEETPDTVLVLIDGTKYVVSESVDDIVERVIEFVRSVRADARWQTLPLMMVTSETGLDHMTEAMEAGADEYAMKPFDRSVIADKLQILGLA